MLGVIFAVLSAATFALNNATVRRGVITGTPFQAVAVTIPIGLVGFLLIAIAASAIGGLASFPVDAAAWMAAVGPLHFIAGRYCNYCANQAVGVNLSAPVIQLQVVVTLVLAVAVLHEPCTVLQLIGGFFILAGPLVTQRQSSRKASVASVSIPRMSKDKSVAVNSGDKVVAVFTPRGLVGYMYACLAALTYGITPIIARFALENVGPNSGILGGLIAYCAATAFITLAFFWPALRRDVMLLKVENVRWFAYTGIFVALAQGFFFSAVAVAPVMLVMPILQLSLPFRLILSTWLSRDHEVLGALVILGTVSSIVGALLVSVNTDVILSIFVVPETLVRLLRARVGG